jgi:predicted PurR-regulated permease PerM
METDRIEQLAVIAILGVLVVGCVVVLKPFFAALLWAVILVCSTWPAFAWIERRAAGRRSLAALVMTLVLAAALLGPIVFVGSSVAGPLKALPETARALIERGLPQPPDWVHEIPFVGDRVDLTWREIVADPKTLGGNVDQVVRPVTDWMLQMGARLGGGVLELTLSVIATFFFYRDGKVAGETLHAISNKLAGARATRLIAVAETTMNSVVYGILGTGLAQALLATFGFALAGVPGALLWGFFTFLLSIVMIGAPLIWLPATIWLLSEGRMEWGIFMAVWGFFVVSGVDNFLKPYFISRGTTLPLLLVFCGVLGGVFAFGLLGIFIGPTLLAIAFTLIAEWSTAERKKAGAADEAASP